MKELSIEQKAKAYDEALERAKSVIEQNPLMEYLKKGIEYIFPELKESEDEKIKKWLIELVEEIRKANPTNVEHNGMCSEALAWLEKQVEQNPNPCENCDIATNNCQNFPCAIRDGKQKSDEYTLEQAADIFLDALSNTPYNNKLITDAQVITRELFNFLQNPASYNPDALITNEQKPVIIQLKFKIGDVIKRRNSSVTYTVTKIDTSCFQLDGGHWLKLDRMSEFELVGKKAVDTVEPKFKVGDIITNGKIIGKVDENENNKYHGWFGYNKDLSVHYADIPDVENWHLWTIQDAKDGDVLCCESGWTYIFKALDNHNNTFSSYCFMDYDNWFCNTGSECHTLDKTFIKAYNREIYPATKEQRDALIKAMTDAGYTFDFEKKELKKIEQNPAWSEEDERHIDTITSLLKDRKKEQSDWGIEVLNEEIAWLKSLKDRYTWKPSDEQIVWLYRAADDASKDSRMKQVLNELLKDLKKLVE